MDHSKGTMVLLFNHVVDQSHFGAQTRFAAVRSVTHNLLLANAATSVLKIH